MNNIQEIWSSFKDLEYELITLSKYIYICKDNYNVYSSKIASLILYANVEIESALSIIGTTNKDMVGESIGETLNNCNRAWSLDKKTVALLNRNFHLDNDSKVITPVILQA